MPLSLFAGVLLCLSPQAQDRPQAAAVASPPLGTPVGGGLVGGSTQPMPSRLQYPPAPDIDRFAPFTSSSGTPLPAIAAACGAADFDRDGHVDLWFLNDATAELSVQMARASSLGRMRAWNTYAARPWVNAATFRSIDYSAGDRVLLVDPQSPSLIAAYYSYPPNDPRAGFFAVNPVWPVGSGAFAIACRDDAGDGHDDITVLIAAPNGTTEVRKLQMGTQLMGTLGIDSTVLGTLPAPARALRMFDFDADGRSDVVVHVPGVGIAVLRDDGRLGFAVVHITPFAWPIESLFVGDANRDGLDDWGVVLPQGILLALSRTSTFTPLWLPHPGLLGNFANACVLGDGRGLLTSIVAFAGNGRGFAVYPSLGGTSFGAPEIRFAPLAALGFQGPGLSAESVLVADVDGDGDQDAVQLLPDQSHWLRLVNGEFDLRSVGLGVVSRGVLGESGYTQYEVTATMPSDGLTRGYRDVECAVFIEDISLTTPRHIYWGRLIAPVDPATRQVRFTLYNQEDKTKLLPMLQQRKLTPFPGGISTGGDFFLSLHWKQSPMATSSGSQRCASVVLYHDGGVDPQKSAVGVKWEVRAEPPKPSADDDLMPWN